MVYQLEYRQELYSRNLGIQTNEQRCHYGFLQSCSRLTPGLRSWIHGVRSPVSYGYRIQDSSESLPLPIPLVCVPRILICIYYHHLLLAFYKAIYLFVQYYLYRHSIHSLPVAVQILLSMVRPFFFTCILLQFSIFSQYIFQFTQIKHSNCAEIETNLCCS